jgi:hypothetical protein
MLSHGLCLLPFFDVACTGFESRRSAQIDEPVLVRKLPGTPVRTLLR